jgi:hypothetical protein
MLPNVYILNRDNLITIFNNKGITSDDIIISITDIDSLDVFPDLNEKYLFKFKTIDFDLETNFYKGELCKDQKLIDSLTLNNYYLIKENKIRDIFKIINKKKNKRVIVQDERFTIAPALSIGIYILKNEDYTNIIQKYENINNYYQLLSIKIANNLKK